MKAKEGIIRKVSKILREANFEVAECLGIHSAFDIIAKNENSLLIVKILSNIEALNSKNASDLKRVADVISGSPIVIGNHMKGKKLLNGVVYFRYGISVVNLNTFKNIILKKKFPKIHAVRGDYCVRINPHILSNLRKKFKITQEELARELGISKQSVYRYESFGSISFEIAEKIVKMFGEDLLIPEIPFFRCENVREYYKTYENRRRIGQRFSVVRSNEIKGGIHMPKLKKIVISELENIGFKISVTNAPFDLVAIEIPKKEKIFTIVGNDPKGIKRRAEIIKKISSMLHSYKVCISEKEQNIDIFVIKPKELSEITTSKELLRLLKEEE